MQHMSQSPPGSESITLMSDTEAPSFLQPAASVAASFWRRTWVRGVLVVLFLLLTTGLLLQIAFHQRERLSAQFPDMTPLLQATCTFLGCDLLPLREIESIRIESSSFNQVLPNIYRLSLTLRNSSAFELAAPAIELSLTDGLDQVIVRRVLLADEWQNSSPAKPEVPARGEISATRLLSLELPNSPERVAGYRLLAFYP